MSGGGAGAPGSEGGAAPAAPCRWLRARSRYGRPIDGIPWESGLSPIETYWCLLTSEPAGPDEAPVHATWCASGRGCYEALKPAPAPAGAD